jgi:hypothetical protein
VQHLLQMAGSSARTPAPLPFQRPGRPPIGEALARSVLTHEYLGFR